MHRRAPAPLVGAYDYSNTDFQAGPTNGSGHMNTVAGST
jgi:hypothetical protein